MYSPPPLCYTVANYSLAITEFSWDVDTCFAAVYEAENVVSQRLVIRILQERSKLINH